MKSRWLAILLIAFLGKLQAQVLLLENFNSGIPGTWTIVNGGASTHTWFGTTNGYNGNTLDGSQFAFVDSDAAGNNPHPLLSEQLISPSINTTGLTTILLEFDQYYLRYSTDRGYVEVFNGSTWVTVATISATTGGWNNPNHAVYNITAHSNANLQVRFRYEDNNVWAWYWAVDNVKIHSPAAFDARATAITIPTDQCGYTTTESIGITGTNNGTNTITSLQAHYQVNGGGIITENVNGNFAPGATINHNFSTTTNMSAAGPYAISAWFSLAGDPDPANDSLFGNTVNHIRVNSFPYHQDFEAGQGGWFSSGTNNTWAYGNPAKNVIQGAASGSKAWVTGGLGNTPHGNNEQNQVEGPCFDLSSVTAPWVGLNGWWNSEFSWDGANLQSSVDGGQSWQTLGNNLDPYNWYTDNTIDGAPGGSNLGWTGRNSSQNGSGGWTRSVHHLAGLAGQQKVIFRVAFGSDASVTDDGFAFDDFSLGAQPIINLGPDTLACGDLILDAGAASSYLWNDSSTSQTLVASSSGQYAVTITDIYGFPSGDAIFVTIDGPRTWDLGADTLICGASNFSLMGPSGMSSYAWQDGSSNPNFPVNSSGIFWLTVTNANGCIQSDTVTLTFSPLQAGIMNVGDTLCRGVPIQFMQNAIGATSWLWNFGNGNLSTNANPTTVFSSGGTFLVRLEVSDGLCTDAITEIFFVDICTGQDEEQLQQFSLAPNPTNGPTFITLGSPLLSEGRLKVVGMNGSVLLEETLPSGTIRHPLTLDQISSGIYMIILETEDGRASALLSLNR